MKKNESLKETLAVLERAGLNPHVEHGRKHIKVHARQNNSNCCRDDEEEYIKAGEPSIYVPRTLMSLDEHGSVSREEIKRGIFRWGGLVLLVEPEKFGKPYYMLSDEYKAAITKLETLFSIIFPQKLPRNE